jgi:magnesium chelatase subunit D
MPAAPAARNGEVSMVGEAIFPFSALVGQDAMKRALILAAIHPGWAGS